MRPNHALRGLLKAALASAALLSALPAAAADAPDVRYPSKPIRVLVGFSPGGAVDIVARQLAQGLASGLGQSVVVDNKPGATGTIAADLAAKAAPDGLTLLVATQSTMVVAPGLFPRLPFDPVRDFAPVSQIASVPLVLVTHPSVPVNSVQELIALARAKPGELTYASSGHGGPQHVATELLAGMASVSLVHVPYKGEAVAITDLLGGQVPVMFANLPAAMPHVRAGRVRALAVSSAQRVASAPELPTVAESGLPGFEALTWFALFAPAATPRPIVERLHAEVVRTLARPEIRTKLTEQGLTLVGGSPAQLAATLQTELPKWAKLVKSANIRPE